MEADLAVAMTQYQDQMSKEITGKCVGMDTPVAVTFWETDRMHPSSEDLTLIVYEILLLVLDATSSASCVVDMNIYCLGDHISGFTLDSVDDTGNEPVR